VSNPEIKPEGRKKDKKTTSASDLFYEESGESISFAVYIIISRN
jgi:hypothetical protein